MIESDLKNSNKITYKENKQHFIIKLTIVCIIFFLYIISTSWIRVVSKTLRNSKKKNYIFSYEIIPMRINEKIYRVNVRHAMNVNFMEIPNKES